MWCAHAESPALAGPPAGAAAAGVGVHACAVWRQRSNWPASPPPPPPPLQGCYQRNPGAPWKPPSGYSLVAMAKLQGPTLKDSLPFAAVILQRGYVRKLVIVIRGSQTKRDWAADFRHVDPPQAGSWWRRWSGAN